MKVPRLGLAKLARPEMAMENHRARRTIQGAHLTSRARLSEHAYMSPEQAVAKS